MKQSSHYETILDRILYPLVKYHHRGNLPTIAGEPVIPWNDPSKYLALRLSGIKMDTYVKGGASNSILAINGPNYKSLYESCGLPSSRLSVTGSPTHDILVERRNAFEDEESPEIFDNHGIPTDQPVAVFFGQALDRDYFPGEYHETASKVIESLIERNYQVVVKTHPKQSISEYDYLPQGSTTLIDTAALPFTDNTKTNIDLVLSSDLVVTQGSTVGYMAMATETPILTYNFNGIPTADCYNATGGSLHALTEEAFDSNLNSLQEDDQARDDLRREQRAVVEDYTMLDGNVTDRFVTLLSELADDE
jgi:CDP-glycerol glycerophosphotransferase (TagB/SpsB family)